MSSGAIIMLGMLCAIFLGCVVGFGLWAIKHRMLVLFAALLALFVVAVIAFTRLGFISFGSHIIKESANEQREYRATPAQADR